MLTMNLSRRIVPAIMAIGVAAVFAGGPTFAQGVVKVGAPLPLTGPVSPEGLKQKRGYDIWARSEERRVGKECRL